MAYGKKTSLINQLKTGGAPPCGYGHFPQTANNDRLRPMSGRPSPHHNA